MQRWIFLIVMLGLAVSSAVAQPDPRVPVPGDPREPNRQPFLMNPDGQVMLVTANGLYAMNAGSLARFDAKTLEVLGVAELFGPMPEAPNFDNPNALQRGAMERWQMAMQQRMSPTTLVAQGDDHVIVIVGDQFFRINQRTLAVERQISLQVPVDEREPGEEPFYSTRTRIEGNLVYLMRGIRLYVIDTAKGELLAGVRMPEELTPRYPEPKQGQEPQKEPPREVTIIGTLIIRPNKEGAIYTLKDEGGREFLLGEAQRDTLVAAVTEATRQIRVTGMLSPYDGPHLFVAGRLEIQQFQVLPQ